MKKDTVELEKLSEQERAQTKVIALMNNKGGCGKTTTSLALGMYLARMGKNVLFWDSDPQSNLTQRLGLSDDKYKDRRLNFLFRNANATFTNQAMLSLIIRYPYLYRLEGSTSKPGKIGLMAGSHHSEIDANSLESRLKTGFEDLAYRNIYRYFKDCVDFFRNYYDYIIIDTAPALEGNILNRLALRTANEIIYPIDGLEAALGVKGILSWMNEETGNQVKPNGLFALVKYQMDTKNVASELPELPNIRVRNSVYRVLKDIFGEFVCDNGVRELRKLRAALPGFGGKTQYTELCREITNKLSQPNRANIFEYASRNGLFVDLQSKLASIEERLRIRRPKFRNPRYT